MERGKNLEGCCFGYLTVIEKYGSDFDKWGNRTSYWKCNCICGKELIVPRYDLVRSRKKSCGCMRYKAIGQKKKTHGLSKTRLYRIWSGMKQRCLNPDNKYFHNYGGRGINVYQPWIDNFLVFQEWALENGYNDMLTIERINVNGNYEPSNCCWIPREEQPKNTRISKRYTYKGVTRTLRDWSVLLGGCPDLVKDRLKRGWDIEDAITISPIKEQKHEKRTKIDEG